MSAPRLALALRSLAALGLAAPAACTRDNLAFHVAPGEDTEPGSGTGPGTTGGTTGPGTSTTATTGVTTGPTTGAVSGSGSTTTGEPPGSTSVADSTSGSTSIADSTSEASTDTGPDSTTGGCAEKVLEIQAEADGFYISGGTMLGATCDYVAKIEGYVYPCSSLNFGVTKDLRMVRAADTYEAMYVVRFPKAAFAQLAQAKVTGATAELVLSMFAAPPPVLMRVGRIMTPWDEGTKDGLPATKGDSSFEDSRITNVNYVWPGDDGPRGASTEVAELAVPEAFPDPSFLESTSFSLDPWLDAPDQAEGLVLSFYKEAGVGTEGPSVNTLNHDNAKYHPFLRVHYCPP